MIIIRCRYEGRHVRYSRLRRCGCLRPGTQPHDGRGADEHGGQGPTGSRQVDDGRRRQRRLDAGGTICRRLPVPHRRLQEHRPAAMRRVSRERRHLCRDAAPPTGEGRPSARPDATRHPTVRQDRQEVSETGVHLW